MSAPLGYFGGEAMASFRRGGAMSLVAVLALSLASLAVGSYLLLQQNTDYWLSQAEDRFEAVIYLKDGIDEAKATSVGNALKLLPEVKELSLVSPADAAKELSKDASVAETFSVLGGENPLPWTARVKCSSADAVTLRALASKAVAIDGVSDVDWGQESVEALLKWMKLLRSSLLGLGLALAFGSVLVTASVIRMTVYARREEIAIMRMVGASHAFIRIPLLLEGALQGLIGGSLALALMLGLGRLTAHRAVADLQLDISAYLPFGVTVSFALLMLAASSALGFLGSLLAVLGTRGEKR